MPELPEVETVVRQIAPAVEGRILQRIEIFDHKLALDSDAPIVGRRVKRLERLGKTILFVFEGKQNEDRFLGVHLRMTGRLLIGSGPESVPYLRARLHFDSGCLDFADVRRFGTMKLASSFKDFDTGGIDPLDNRLTAKLLQQKIGRSRQPIKQWLLRQDRLVGLGNIYASEILFASGIDPFRPAEDLADEEISCLFRHMRRILRKAISFCGTTFSDFQNARGEDGGFQDFLNVYGHEGDPCPHCKTTIQRVLQQQRSTFYCPTCQK